MTRRSPRLGLWFVLASAALAASSATGCSSAADDLDGAQPAPALAGGEVHGDDGEGDGAQPSSGGPAPGSDGDDTPGDDPGVVPSGGDCVAGGRYCGGDKVIGDAKTLYECNGPGAPTVVEKCAYGCAVNPGSDDACKAAPGACAVTAVPDAPYLANGLHPAASNALAYLKITAARITQTIGSAAASAGTHAQDGVAGGHAYSAATDLSVLGMTDAQVAVLLDQLTSVGFVAYYRKPGSDGWPASEARHLHVVWAGAPMKLSLRNQVRDWHVGKNALASHTTYTFKTWTPCWRDAIWARYLTANPATN